MRLTQRTITPSREEDIPQICEEYDKLAKGNDRQEKAGKGFNFFHFMIDLTGGPCVYKRLSGCGSGTEYLAVTRGAIFIHVISSLVTNSSFWETWTQESFIRRFRTNSANVMYIQRKNVKDCFARFYCSGGCAANAYHFHGSINGNYDIGCELQRKRVECAIMIKAALAE